MNDIKPTAPSPLAGAICSDRPFGWEVDVEFHPGSGKPMQTFHWRSCSRRTAHLKGMMKINAQRIVDIRPVSEDLWALVYGLGRM